MSLICGQNISQVLNRVKAVREILGEPDIVEIRKTFPSSDTARRWESTVLRRMKVTTRSDFLNLTDKQAPTMLGQKQSDEMKAKLSAMFKGKPGRIWTDEQRIKSSLSHTGKIFDAEHRSNISKQRKGMVFSEEHKANIGRAQIGRKQSAESQRKRSESLRKYHASRKQKEE